MGGGVAPYGYLGVDVFLVINGYFLIKRLNEQISTNNFSYWKFLFNRLVRFWPLVLFISAILLFTGYFLMLPDDYENLAESVFASSLFANNILQCITTKNYWNVVMRYKPLMHLWYIGLLMQVYVILPLIYIVLCKIWGSSQRIIFLGTAILTIISFFLYLLPFFSGAAKFYYPPFRLFEITAGGLLAFIQIDSLRKSIRRYLLTGVTIALILLLCSRTEIKPGQAMLLGTIIMTLIFLNCNDDKFLSSMLKPFSIVGKCSYSIYIWHQVIVAFLFYSVFQRVNVLSFITFIWITSILSWLTYKFIEIPLQKIKGTKALAVFVVCIIIAILACGFSLKIYKNAGMVRDVPELNISKDNVHRNMHAEYCDIPYSWDKNFSDDNRIKVLVIGNSFGRDFANILNEWDQGKQRLEISYKYYSQGVMEKLAERINMADYVFYAVSFYAVSGAEIPEDIVWSVPSSKLYIIGNKNYGESNGIIYAKRGSKNYFSQTVEIPEELLEQNRRLAKIYKEHYIDMMGLVMADDKHAKVFTDDNKYISQDCRHLTQAGAQYYSRILGLEKLFLINN